MRAELARSQFRDPAWRLNHLYWIVDRSGNRVQFRFNRIQEQLYKNLHDHNVI